MKTRFIIGKNDRRVCSFTAPKKTNISKTTKVKACLHGRNVITKTHAILALPVLGLWMALGLKDPRL
jgi:hypothetical protein